MDFLTAFMLVVGLASTADMIELLQATHQCELC